MSKFNVGDRRSNLMHKLVYVGGPNPWRESDADGWIAHDGSVLPDFGQCELIDVRMRSGRIAQRTTDEIREASGHRGSTWWWAVNQNGDPITPFCSDDKTAWRPAASNVEAAPELTRENAKFALVTSDIAELRGCAFPALLPLAGKVLPIVARNEVGNVRVEGCTWWFGSLFWTPNPGPASAPKAEEPAKEKPEPLVILTMNMLSAEAAAIRAARAVGAGLTYVPSPDTPMLQRDEREESARERAYREGQEFEQRRAEHQREQSAIAARWQEKPAGLLLVAPIWSPR